MKMSEKYIFFEKEDRTYDFPISRLYMEILYFFYTLKKGIWTK